MNLVVEKLAAAVILLTLALLMGLLPFCLLSWLRRRTSSSSVSSQPHIQLLFSCIQCFGAGILLSTVFTHMLPEVRQGLEVALPALRLPLAEILLCAGMFTIYTIEELVEVGLRCGGGTRSHECQPHTELVPSSKRTGAGGDYGTLAGSSASVEGDDRHGDSWDERGAILDHQEHAHQPAGSGSGSGFRVFVVVVALSVHSIFEGMAVGLELRSVGMWMLVAANAAHKSIISFCLGEQLASSTHKTRSALVTLMVFVAASPAGILIGIVVTQVRSSGGGDQSIPANVLQALAAGSILYVVFFEIIQGEREKSGSGLVKLLAVLLGFGCMLSVVLLVEVDEGEGPRVILTASPLVSTPAAKTRA